MNEPIRNWAGNITYATKSVHTPRTVAEVQDIVRDARKARALGSRHSFNRIADTDEDLISLQHLNRVVSLDKAARTVTVEGGITYGQLCPLLDAEGFALHNLASLPHISVVGACTTATHGSGNTNMNLAAAVSSLEIVTASGEIVTLSRGEPDFEGAVVGLGGLGIVTRTTLDILPRFEVRQNVYVDLPFSQLVENFDALTSSAYSVSAFTHWRGDHVAQVWLKSLADAPHPGGDFFGARPADRPYHPIASIDPAPATEQMGVAGPWHERLPHFRMAFVPSAGAELQSEYFVPRTDAAAALQALRLIQDQIAPHLLVSEIRTIAADGFWMSPAYRQDSVAFHFTWKQDWAAVSKVLPVIEAQLNVFGTRPHWGKLFTMPGRDVEARYERLADFRELLRRTDPDGKFRNAFLDAYVF
ncbi:MAG TPA: FAD-binding protein [Devosiaceae bacterium]|nr:FAD-binding protein [Devosiaceae bacterium]